MAGLLWGSNELQVKCLEQCLALSKWLWSRQPCAFPFFLINKNPVCWGWQCAQLKKPSLCSLKRPRGTALQWDRSESCWAELKRGVNSANIRPSFLPDFSWLNARWDHTVAETVSKPSRKDQENYTELSSGNRDPVNSCHHQSSSVVLNQWGGKRQALTDLRDLFWGCCYLQPDVSLTQLALTIINLSPTTIYFIICLKLGFPSRWKVSYSRSYNVSHQAGTEKC